MSKQKPTDPLSLIKRVNRERRLQEYREKGRPVAKSWGGKKSPQEERRDWRNNRHRQD